MPLELECSLVESIDLGGSNGIFIGEIVEAYAEEKYVTKRLTEIEKIRPVIFAMHANKH